jgi:chromosome partitioning protein
MASPLVIGVLNQKGGVGKTMITTNLATCACAEGIKLAAIADLDPNEGSGRWSELHARECPEVMVGESDPDEAVEKLEMAGYEVVFLDGAPNAIELTEAAVQACDLVVIPLRASDQDARATSYTVSACRDLGKPYLLVVNEARSERDKAAADLIRTLRSIGEPIYETPIRHRAPYVEACNAGRGVTDFTGKRWAEAAAEMRALYNEVMRRARESREAFAA